jgi:hypothetical protein
MLARPEFHPLAVRVSTLLLSLLSPSMCNAGSSADESVVLTEQADLVVRQRGSQIAVACTVRIENRTRSPVQLCWRLPQPPLANADLPAGGELQMTSHHLYLLGSAVDAMAQTSLHVQLAAALPSRTRRSAIRPSLRRGVRDRTRAHSQTAGDANQAAIASVARLGIAARLRRHAGGGLICHARDTTLWRGALHGAAVRVLIAEPTDGAPHATIPPYAALERLLGAARR